MLVVNLNSNSPNKYEFNTKNNNHFDGGKKLVSSSAPKIPEYTITPLVQLVALANSRHSNVDKEYTKAFASAFEKRRLKVNYGSQLDAKFEIKGLAEIITKNKKLIERLFDNLKYVAKV